MKHLIFNLDEIKLEYTAKTSLINIEYKKQVIKPILVNSIDVDD